MRHSCLFAAVSLILLTLSGCRMESSGNGSSAFNPATDVSLTFSTFSLSQKTDTTLFADLIAAVEPNPSEISEFDTSEVAEGIRSQLSLFMGIQYSENRPPLTIEAVRNPLDLIRRVIGENEVLNFQEGRRYISSRIDENVAGEYSNRTAGAQVQFVDETAFLENRPVQDVQWPYPIVKWVYTPDTSNLVTRILTWSSLGSFPEGSTRPSATLGTEFKPQSFQSTGYNDEARSKSEGSIVIEGEREMSFVRTYDGANNDTLIIDGTATGTNKNTTGGPAFEFAGEQIDCLKIVMDYEAPSVSIYKSVQQPPGTAEYCSEKTTPDYSYATVETGLRP